MGNKQQFQYDQCKFNSLIQTQAISLRLLFLAAVQLREKLCQQSQGKCKRGQSELLCSHLPARCWPAVPLCTPLSQPACMGSYQLCIFILGYADGVGTRNLLAGNGYTKTLSSIVFLSGIFLPLHSDLKVPPKEKFAWRHLKSPHPTTRNCRNTMEEEPHSETGNLAKPKSTSLLCLPCVTLHGLSALLTVLVLPCSPLFNHAKNSRV